MHAGAEVCIAKLAVEVRGIDPAALNKVCLKHDPRLHQALALEQPPRGVNALLRRHEHVRKFKGIDLLILPRLVHDVMDAVRKLR